MVDWGGLTAVGFLVEVVAVVVVAWGTTVNPGRLTVVVNNEVFFPLTACNNAAFVAGCLGITKLVFLICCEIDRRMTCTTAVCGGEVDFLVIELRWAKLERRDGRCDESGCWVCWVCV